MRMRAGDGRCTIQVRCAPAPRRRPAGACGRPRTTYSTQQATGSAPCSRRPACTKQATSAMQRAPRFRVATAAPARTRPHACAQTAHAVCRVVRVRQQRPVRLCVCATKVSWAFTTKDYDITILVVRDDDGKETQVRTDRTDGARRRTSPGRTHRVAWYSRAAALPVRDRDELYPKPSLHAPPPTLPAPYTLICLHGMASASGSASSAQSGVARGVYTASPTCKTDFSGHDDQSIKTCRRRWWRRRRSSRT